MNFSLKRRNRDRERESERSRDVPRDELPRRRDDGERREKKHRHDGNRHADRVNGSGVSSGGGSSDDVEKRRRLSGAGAVQHAKSHLFALTGRRPEAVSGLSRTREGWRVVIEIVELERIPRTTDILASYAVDIDNHGELIGYQRVSRYYRSDVSGES